MKPGDSARGAPFDGLPVPQRWWSAATIWLALALSVLDSAIANVALPTIARDLAASPAEAVWVVNAYQLTIVISLLPGAALGEIVGYRRVYLCGMVLFTLASIGCAFASSLPVLAIARAIQGFGAAGIMSVNPALVRFTYPMSQLGRGLGFNALVAASAAALGPTVASGILAVASWPWLFAINLPLGIAAFAIGRTALPRSPTSGRLDVPSTVLNVLMFGPFFIGIDLLTRGGIPWVGGVALALGATAGIVLFLRSRHQARPLVPIDLLADGMFSLSIATSVGSFAAQTLALVSLPFFFEGALHRSAVETGLLMTPWAVAIGIGAPVAGRLADRLPAAILSGAGLLAMAGAMALLAALPTDASTGNIVWRMVLCGLGFGFFQTPNNRTLLSAAPLERSGAAGGMLATARLTGQTLGATIAAITFRLAENGEMVALAVAAALSGAAAVASVARLLHGRGPSRSPSGHGAATR